MNILNCDILALFLFDLTRIGEIGESLGGWASLLPLLFVAVNAVRAALLWLEPVLLLWFPLETSHGFWDFWIKLLKTLDYVTGSFPRQQAVTRKLIDWDRSRKGLPSARWIANAQTGELEDKRKGQHDTQP